MIANDNELRVMQQRIVYFQGLLAQFRVTATPQQFPLMASGYTAEIETMQQEIMDYLTRHITETRPAKAG